MADIVVRVRGVERRFRPEQSPITIGRAATAAVVADAEAVSSTHAQLTFENGQWVYRDQSTNGSYVNNTPSPVFSISQPVIVVLDNVEHGVMIELGLEGQLAPAGPVMPPAAVIPAAGPPPGTPPPGMPPPGTPPPGGPPPTAGGPPPPGPGGGQKLSSVFSETQMAPQELRSAAAAAAAYGAQAGPQDVKIQYEGGEFVAHVGQTVTFGRDPFSDVTLDNPTVSRHHAQLAYGAQGWQLDDVGSSRGLTVDGQPVRQVLLRGTTDVWFGPEEAGVRVIFVAPGKSKKKGGVSPLVIVAPIVAVLLIALVAIVLVARNSSTQVATGGTTPPELDITALKKGTVRIEGRFKLSKEQRKSVDEQKKAKGKTADSPDFTGSGTILTSDGLVLTNAHVATPDQVDEGGEKSPPVESLKVARNPTGGDEPLEATDDAEVVNSDPKLDLAVIKIQGASNLPTIPLGNDQTLKAGEEIFILGFPGVAGTAGVNVTGGRVSSFVPDKKLEIDRAWINTDAKIDPGNSGGLAANKEGKIIGVPTLVCFRPFSGSSDQRLSQQNRVRVIDLARPIVDASKNGTDYEQSNADQNVCPR